MNPSKVLVLETLIDIGHEYVIFKFDENTMQLSFSVGEGDTAFPPPEYVITLSRPEEIKFFMGLGEALRRDYTRQLSEELALSRKIKEEAELELNLEIGIGIDDEDEDEEEHGLGGPKIHL